MADLVALRHVGFLHLLRCADGVVVEHLLSGERVLAPVMPLNSLDSSRRVEPFRYLIAWSE
eukprot:1366383-Amphidinium_carterae.1